MYFYVIDNPRFDDSIFAYGEDFGEINLAPALRCEVCGSALTSRRWLPPHEIRVSKRQLGDFIYGTFPNFIVSSKFKTLFEGSGLTGINSFSPVAIYFRKQLLDEIYYLPEVLMSDVHIDLERSGFEFEGTKRCPACQNAGSIIKKWDAIIFERPENIDLDIFSTKVLGEMALVSERFRVFVLEHGFSNISMLDASKYGTAWSTG